MQMYLYNDWRRDELTRQGHTYGEVTHSIAAVTHSHAAVTYSHGAVTHSHGTVTNSHAAVTHSHTAVTHSHGTVTLLVPLFVAQFVDVVLAALQVRLRVIQQSLQLVTLLQSRRRGDVTRAPLDGGVGKRLTISTQVTILV